MTSRSEVAELTARIVADRWTHGDDRTRKLAGGDVAGARGRRTSVGRRRCRAVARRAAHSPTRAMCSGSGVPSAVPVPVAETGILAGWSLAAAGLAIPDGPTTLAVAPERRRRRHVARRERAPGHDAEPGAVGLPRLPPRRRVRGRRPRPRRARTNQHGRGHARSQPRGGSRDHVAVDLVLDDQQVAVLPDGVETERPSPPPTAALS